MSTPTAREAMLEMGQQFDPVREALRRMIAEFGDQHYHTCPADDDSGPCDCFAGHLIKDVQAALAAQQDVREARKPPHKETIAREIRRAMLDNPSDGGFNERAEKREKIADATADAILKLFATLEQSRF